MIHVIYFAHMIEKKPTQYTNAYIVTVDMGYGHQRAVYPLRDIAAAPVGWSEAQIISANRYPGIPAQDRRTWEGTRKVYETISRLKQVPLIGDAIFNTMDYFQQIAPFYPKRDLSRPSTQVKQIYRLIRSGWGKSLIDTLNQKPLPFVTSFFTTAFFAEEHGYKGPIYCLCTDTDISRAWAPLDPKHSRIIYLAPNKRVKERLQLYGVKQENIIVTGFPLPLENIGKNLSVIKESLRARIAHLDPHHTYQKKYESVLRQYLGPRYAQVRSRRPLTITFAIGGAGAQREIGQQILESLQTHIKKGQVCLQLVTGIKKEVYVFYQEAIKTLGLQKQVGKQILLVYAENKMDYFSEFNKALLTTDILWTKPSELSFYAGLGLPIIIAPTIGSQEEYNRAWLHSIGVGFEQQDPLYTHQWLFDLIESGRLAQSAMEGFLNASHNGAYHIAETVLKGKRSEIEESHLL